MPPKICIYVDLRPRGLISGFRLKPRQVQNRLWAEVVGLTAVEAERKIKEQMAGVQIQVVPHDAFVTMDYQSKRVRIFVDSSGKVTKPPRIG